MILRLNLQKRIIRIITLAAALGVLLFLVKVILSTYVVGTLVDETDVDKRLLLRATTYFPDSAQLLAELAEAETKKPGANLESAEKHALEAVKLSPHNYTYRLLVAQVRDARGDQAGAEESLNEALKLAPYYSEVHWRMANLLVREGRTEEAIPHFRFVAKTDLSLVPAILDLVWAVSNKNVLLLKTITADNPNAQLKLALFLANQSYIPEAAEIFGQLDKELILSSTETSSSFFDLLIKKGFPLLASNLWKSKIVSEDKGASNQSLIWNGDFESSSLGKLNHFDWKLKNTDYARTSIDSTKGHSGNHSLLLVFLGRDTTKLDNEVSHLFAIRPGATYQLDYYVSTANLQTPDGPKVVISDITGKKIAESESISSEIKDWKHMSFNFIAPPKGPTDGDALFISVKRQPRLAYDDPTKGSIWFDDFALSEVNNGK